MEAIDRVLKQRSVTRPWYRGGSLIAAIVLHVGLVAAALIAPSLFAERPRPQQFVSIQIVPAAALGQIEVPPPPPPAARAAPEPPPPAPPPPPPPPAVEPEPAPRRDPERERTTRPQVEPPQPAVPAPPPPADPSTRDPARPDDLTDPSSTAGPGRLGSPQGNPLATGGPAEISGFDDPNFTYSYYAELMLARIRARWQRPPLGGEIEMVVYFKIDAEGRVSGLEIVQSSGYNSFDRAGLRAVQTATLPPLPTSYRKGSLGVRLIIR
ncbi:MAG TPA: TonB family protein [Thermoanaerobaculia bacterium]|nr:TonB family protein [Thermoanaerobaculia bacterium]